MNDDDHRAEYAELTQDAEYKKIGNEMIDRLAQVLHDVSNEFTECCFRRKGEYASAYTIQLTMAGIVGHAIVVYVENFMRNTQVRGGGQSQENEIVLYCKEMLTTLLSGIAGVAAGKGYLSRVAEELLSRIADPHSGGGTTPLKF